MHWFLTYIEWHPNVVSSNSRQRAMQRHRLQDKLMILLASVFCIINMTVVYLVSLLNLHPVIWFALSTLIVAALIFVFVHFLYEKVADYIDRRYPLQFEVSK